MGYRSSIGGVWLVQLAGAYSLCLSFSSPESGLGGVLGRGEVLFWGRGLDLPTSSIPPSFAAAPARNCRCSACCEWRRHPLPYGLVWRPIAACAIRPSPALTNWRSAAAWGDLVSTMAAQCPHPPPTTHHQPPYTTLHHHPKDQYQACCVVGLGHNRQRRTTRTKFEGKKKNRDTTSLRQSLYSDGYFINIQGHPHLDIALSPSSPNNILHQLTSPRRPVSPVPPSIQRSTTASVEQSRSQCRTTTWIISLPLA